MARIVPNDGWENVFPSDLLIKDLNDLFDKEEFKKRRKEGFILYREKHVTTLQTCQRGDVWWMKALCEATQRTKLGIWYLKSFSLSINSFFS
jgi:hypothetical protein